MQRKHLALALLGALTIAWAPLAHADLISVGLQQAGTNSGDITTVATGSGNVVIGVTNYGTFTVNDITAQDTADTGLPTILDSTSLNTSSTTAGTLEVWITAQGLTQPTGLANFTSSFTSNALPAGWTVTELTYYDAGNGVYTTTTPLSSATFSAIGTDIGSSSVNFSSPFSITEEYIITAIAGGGTANDTIDTSVPEPGSLLLLATALIGIAAFARRRSSRTV